VRNQHFQNNWTARLQYIQQCVQQVTQLIRLFEGFFRALGYEGLAKKGGGTLRMTHLRPALFATLRKVFSTWPGGQVFEAARRVNMNRKLYIICNYGRYL